MTVSATFPKMIAMTHPAVAALTPLVALAFTIAAYLVGVAMQRRLRTAAANPVLFAIVVIGLTLQATHIPYVMYFAGAQFLHFLLGPATVALAIPLVRSLEIIRRSFFPLLAALLAGSLTSILSGYGIARLLGASQPIALSMVPKGLTTPIAIGVSEAIGGIPSLTVVLAIAAGVLVAIAIEATLRGLRITDWRAVGLAAGTAGSGIGASQVIPKHTLAAAFAGVALGANGLLTALLAPLLAPLLKLW